MFRDFEKAPSKSSYQLKFILAGLALLALLAAWISNSSKSYDLESTQLERDQVTALLDQRNLELETAERNNLNLRSEQEALQESIENAGLLAGLAICLSGSPHGRHANTHTHNCLHMNRVMYHTLC